MLTARPTFFRVIIAVLGMVALCASAPAQTTSPAAMAVPPPGPVQPTTISGTVDSYSLNAEGVPNSMTIKDGDRISQFNLPADAAAVLASSAPAGQKVTAVGTPELLVGDHAIYKLVSLTGTDGKAITAASVNSWQILHVEGTIRQINYASRGEVDGVILDTGDFLHTGRATAATANFAVGQKLTADGWGHPITGGHSLIEPTTLNDRIVKGPDHPVKAGTAKINQPATSDTARPRTGRAGQPRGPAMGGPGRQGFRGQMDGFARRGRPEIRDGQSRQPFTGRMNGFNRMGPAMGGFRGRMGGRGQHDDSDGAQIHRDGKETHDAPKPEMKEHGRPKPPEADDDDNDAGPPRPRDGEKDAPAPPHPETSADAHHKHKDADEDDDDQKAPAIHHDHQPPL